MANVGKNIKRLRTKRGMTQDALAERLFVSRQTVSNYENGKSTPDIDTLVKLAEIFGTDANELIYGPSVSVERKREYRKLAVMAGLLAVTGAGIFMLERSGIMEWCMKRFIGLPSMLLYMVIYPLTGLALGWSAMQAAGLFLGAKRLRGNKSRIIHRILLGILAVYFLAVLPAVIEECISFVKIWQAERQGAGYRFESSGWGRALIGESLWLLLWNLNVKYRGAACLLPGALLWASKPTDFRKNVKEV